MREFCDFNGAEIEYVRGKRSHGFRITFERPESEERNTVSGDAKMANFTSKPEHQLSL